MNEVKWGFEEFKKYYAWVEKREMIRDIKNNISILIAMTDAFYEDYCKKFYDEWKEKRDGEFYTGFIYKIEDDLLYFHISYLPYCDGSEEILKNTKLEGYGKKCIINEIKKEIPYIYVRYCDGIFLETKGE